jgi:hypothetical protein
MSEIDPPITALLAVLKTHSSFALATAFNVVFTARHETPIAS